MNRLGLLFPQGDDRKPMVVPSGVAPKRSGLFTPGRPPEQIGGRVLRRIVALRLRYRSQCRLSTGAASRTWNASAGADVESIYRDRTHISVAEWLQPGSSAEGLVGEVPANHWWAHVDSKHGPRTSLSCTEPWHRRGSVRTGGSVRRLPTRWRSQCLCLPTL